MFFAARVPENTFTSLTHENVSKKRKCRGGHIFNGFAALSKSKLLNVILGTGKGGSRTETIQVTQAFNTTKFN